MIPNICQNVYLPCHRSVPRHRGNQPRPTSDVQATDTCSQFGFLTILSADPANTVFGLVRDKAATDKKVASELGDRKNIHILKADLVDYDALKASISEDAKKQKLTPR